MTSRNLTPPTDRKDMTSLIHHQADAPCLSGECADDSAESVMAFLMRLYACYLQWYARSRGMEHMLPDVFDTNCHDAAMSKTRLYCTVPHEFHVPPRKALSGTANLRVKSVRVPGTNRTEHFVLYPGARRELSLRKGRPISPMRWFDAPQAGCVSNSYKDARTPAVLTLQSAALADYTMCATVRAGNTSRPLSRLYQAEISYLDRTPP